MALGSIRRLLEAGSSEPVQAEPSTDELEPLGHVQTDGGEGIVRQVRISFKHDKNLRIILLNIIMYPCMYLWMQGGASW